MPEEWIELDVAFDEILIDVGTNDMVVEVALPNTRALIFVVAGNRSSYSALNERMMDPRDLPMTCW